MNTETRVRAGEARDDSASQPLPSLRNLRIEKATLVTSRSGEQYVSIAGDHGRAEIRRRLNGADQPYLYVSYHQADGEPAESPEAQVVHLPKLDDALIDRAEIQQIDGVPTVVLTLADDYRILFSAGINDESIAVEFADPSAAVE